MSQNELGQVDADRTVDAEHTGEPGEPTHRRYSVDVLPTHRRTPEALKPGGGAYAFMPTHAHGGAPAEHGPLSSRYGAGAIGAPPPVIPPQRYRHTRPSPTIDLLPPVTITPAPPALRDAVSDEPAASTPAVPIVFTPPLPDSFGRSDAVPSPVPEPLPAPEPAPAPRRPRKHGVRLRVLYRRTEGLRRWAGRVARRGTVLLITAAFTVAVWTPRILWWCISYGSVYAYRGTDTMVRTAWGVLHDASRSTPRPTHNPIKPKPREAREQWGGSANGARHGQGPATQGHDPATPADNQRLRSVEVSAPYRPVVFLAPRRDQDATTTQQHAPAKDDARPPATADQGNHLWAHLSADAPTRPGTPLTGLAANTASNSARPALVPAPSSRRAPEPVETVAPPYKSSGWEMGNVSAGLRNLVLAVLGATVGFMVGTLMFIAAPGPGIVAGVLLMVTGIGGLMFALVQLNEWLSGLRHELTPNTRLGIRALGFAGAVCLLAAFMVTTLPRGVWPI